MSPDPAASATPAPAALDGPDGLAVPTAWEVVGALAAWAPWQPLTTAAEAAPRAPGVYLARSGPQGPLVYVGMAGERRGAGLRGRLRVYASGKAAVSGLGEAALDRALADPEWVVERLAEVRAHQPRRAKAWAQLALGAADLHVCWATRPDRASAAALEADILRSLPTHALWNRRR